MHTSLSHRATLLLIGAGLLICILAGAILVNSFDISIRPKAPNPGTGCTLEALMCPDGSAVVRVPPTCEFAACPYGFETNDTDTTMPDDTDTSGGGGGTVSIAPVMPGDSPMAKIPDQPLSSVPTTSQIVSFVVEHRSALNEKQITVTGIVVMNNLKEEACPPGSMCPMTAMYTMPSIVVADSSSPSRDIYYDLRINMSEEARAQADQYPVGSAVTVTGTVTGSLEGVLMFQVSSTE